MFNVSTRRRLLGLCVATLGWTFTLSGNAFAQVPVTVVEYYNKTIASYFLTGRADEQAALDAVPDFQRTGVTFRATAATVTASMLDSVCRYRIAVTGSAFSSHFYGLPADCAVIAASKPANFFSEGLDFAVTRPSNGTCPASAPVGVFRALRKLTPVDTPNHRYSVSANAHIEMIRRGWNSEGVVFCVASATPETAPPTFVASSTVKDRCVVPRSGSSVYTGRVFPDMPGTQLDEQSWLRSWSDETYLWYREIPNLDAKNYSSTDSWFSALKTPALALSGAAKDRFHFTQSTEAVEAANSGVSFGYGVSFSVIAAPVPRNWRVAVVTPGSPADAAGIKRGDSLVSIDGVSFATGGSTALNNGLFPRTIGERHSFVFAPVSGGANYTANLAAASVAIRPVPTSGIITTPTGRVGYIHFTTFNTFVAEKAIADAVAGLVAAGGVNDLVLDLRYNRGGYVFIAAETAYMIAGPARTGNKTFELFKTNDKKPFGPDEAELFYDQGSGAPGGVAQGQPLPSLNLGRVFVLTQAGSCSASESVISGLRGIDVEVILIGGQTCGKPYAFQSLDNCGVTYSSIQITGVNHKGEGDFINGFAPTCAANDDLTRPLGDPTEKQLAAALTYRATGVCAPVAAGGETTTKRRPADDNAAKDPSAVRESAHPSDSEKMLTPKDLTRNRGAAIVPVTPINLGAVDASGEASAATN
jgi:carboxyl-terminal processing protease